MERVRTRELKDHISKVVTIAGWVDVRRDHGKIIFLDIRDGFGKIQVVCSSDHADALKVAETARSEWVIRVEGVVSERPEKMRTPEPNGTLEITAEKIDVLARAQEIPFEKDTEVNLDTLLDYRPFTLRSERERAIFRVQATVLDAYRRALAKRGFVEFIAPGIVGGDAEGGAAVFKLNYHYGQPAYLATSPQLYKQIMVGAYERVYTIAKAFRAEKSATTRHLSESTQMDFEMGFVSDERDVMNVLEEIIRDVLGEVANAHQDAFGLLKTDPPRIGKKFPVLTLAEALQTIGVGDAADLTPEDERKICEWALKEHDSDFVFITRFPTSVRAFYTYEDPQEAPLSRGFDLLFRGLEINSGSQRIESYEEMVERMHERNMDPKKFSFYLQAFKYGMPPHGGCSTGLERFTARLLNLANVKEAALFPRDLNRIDTRLTTDEAIPD